MAQFTLHLIALMLWLVALAASFAAGAMTESGTHSKGSIGFAVFCAIFFGLIAYILQVIA